MLKSVRSSYLQDSYWVWLKYKSLELMRDCLEQSGTNMVTVAFDVVNWEEKTEKFVLVYIPKGCPDLPYSRFCYIRDSSPGSNRQGIMRNE